MPACVGPHRYSSRGLFESVIAVLQRSCVTGTGLQVNTGYVGHLSKPELLSGLVLAASLSTATGYNIMSGISTATETVCGQAYGACLHAA